ncbi:MAG: MBL fold metallo-hydrolase, partial [Chloroflexota bacterium]
MDIAGKKVLVDAGIRISPKSSRGLQNDQLPHLAYLDDIGGPDVILITHAHTDHTGALPQVVRSYPRVPIYATGATIELSRVLLQDSSRLMEGRFEEEGELPLYDADDVERLFKMWQPVDFDRAHKLGANLQATFSPSGHIAGAAMITFESPEGVLVMGGDDSVAPQRTVVSAKPPRLRADALVLESTYGGRPHANRPYEERRLVDTIKEVIDGGGKVLIPAFALGRAQEVIQIMHAFRDEIKAPVYVDGMVRAVCDAYSKFKDILPKETLKMAGNRPLFFRDNVKAVKSKQEREEIMRREEPCIVVASSGMLTGGASVAYAAAFATDEKNAIFLTGYQDEESPGRFLQNVMARKERGDTPILNLGKDRVPIKCHLGKYSLSAHADGDELIGIAEALDAQRVFLVHGDTGARDALWEALRAKKRMVARPKVGQERVIEKRRLLKVDDDSKPDELVEAEALWRMLYQHQGEEFTARELAQLWYNDVEKAELVMQALEDDPLFFSVDWKYKNKFTVRKTYQVEKIVRSHQILRKNPDLPGKLIVLRNANGQPRLGVAETMGGDGSFTGVMQGSKATNHDGDSLVWVIGEFTGSEEDNIKIYLNEMLSEAESITERVMPFETRLGLAESAELVDPTLYITPLPSPLPEGEAGEELIWKYQTELASAVLALARDGARYEYDPEVGLRVERALPSGPVNQQVARDTALKAFPPEARLRKVGMISPKHVLILTFDFPEVATRKFRDVFDQIRMETGWEANPKMTTNQQALSAAVKEVLPPGTKLSKKPSLFMSNKEVTAEVEGLTDAEIAAAEAEYADMTNYTLRLIRRDVIEDAQEVGVIATPAEVNGSAAAGEPLEINEAYDVVRRRLEPLGLQKVGKKGDELVLTFVSPQLGARYTDEIEALVEVTGYAMRVHDYPMQNIILDLARSLTRQAGWSVRKGPGIHTDRGEVSVKLTDPVTDEEVTELSDTLD